MIDPNNPKNVQERIRTLGVKKRDLEKRREQLTKKQSRAINEIVEINKQLKAINIELHDLSQKRYAPLVSEHALVRYLERVKNIDADLLRSEILPEHIVEQIITLGDGTYPVNGFRIVVVNHTVVTVITEDDQPR